MKRYLTLKNIILLASCLLSLIVFCIILIWSGTVTGRLTDQQFADRWSDEGGFAQNSFYFKLGSGISEDNMISLRRSIDSALVAESVDAKYDDRGWINAYSAEKAVTATRGVATCQATATGIGGDFFLFHQMRLINGSYISESDLMHDLIVLDDLAAWFLFGSNDCIGMDVQIGGRTFIVAGVVERDESSDIKLAYGDTARIYMSFEMLGADEISCYETLLPNPIPDFAQKTVINALGISESTYVVTQNTGRFSIPRIYEVIKLAPQNAMRTTPIAYPYWENAARVAENHVSRAYAAMLILLLYPAVVLVVFVVILWRRRKWRAGVMLRTVGDKIYEFRAMKAQKDKPVRVRVPINTETNTPESGDIPTLKEEIRQDQESVR